VTPTHYSDFTIARFAELCAFARERYEFLRLNEPPTRPGVIWRHDVDISVQHALRIAELEANLGVVATYFLLPHSICYNLWAEENVSAARAICALGHDVGLHFDPTFYGAAGEELDRRAVEERRWLEDLLEVEIASVSFHKFEVVRSKVETAERFAGMVNAYGERLQSEYHYVSDSNGVWRFESMFEAIESRRYDRLQALTHPVWWSDRPMAPRRRLQDCIDAAASAMGHWYDETTRQYGRPNIW
jgi:hypothetical protein